MGNQTIYYDKKNTQIGFRGALTKNQDYLGIFPNIGGGGSLNPKTFDILTIVLKKT